MTRQDMLEVHKLRKIRGLTLFRLSLAVTLPIFVGACGLADPSDPITVITDNSNPSVSNVEPRSLIDQKTIDVTTKKIAITFDEDVSPNANWEDAITITPAIAGQFNYDKGTHTLTFTKDGLDNLPYNTDYTLTISTRIKDIAGNVLDRTYSLQFKTADTFKISGQVTGLIGLLKIKDIEDPTKEELSINNDTPGQTKSFTFSRVLLANQKYRIELSQGADSTTFCSIENAIGSISANLSLRISCDRVAPAYASAPTWNSYLRNSSKESCLLVVNGQEQLSTDCFHAGEQRAFTTKNATSCTGLTASDSLQSFDWACAEEIGQVRFVGSLKPLKGLTNLIDFTNLKWKKNKVTITRNGNEPVDASIEAPWWNNPVLSGNSGSFNVAGAVYAVTANTDRNNIYTISTSNVAVVTDTTNATRIALGGQLHIENTRFVWFEGDISAQAFGVSYAMDNAIKITGSTYSTLRNVRATKAKTNGIVVGDSKRISMNNVLVSDSGENGILLNPNSGTGKYGNDLKTITSTLNGGHGIYIDSHENKLYDINTNSNKLSGLYIHKAFNWVNTITTYNNRENGLHIHDGSTNIITQITSVSNNLHGILQTDGSNGANSNIVTHATIAVNGNTGLTASETVTGISHNNYYVNILAALNGTENCSSNNAAICNGVTSITGTLSTLADNFVGSTGNTSTALSNVDFTSRLTSTFRAWGANSGVGACFVGVGGDSNCLERDFSLIATSTLANSKGVPATADPKVTYLLGDNSTTLSALANAVELVSDDNGINDGDGLCEDNESCLYTPNIGSYQGHGNLQTATNDLTNGVDLFKRQTNGY